MTTARTVVLVEGESDRSALLTLARRRGRDLDAEGVEVVEIGGATNLGHALDRFGPRGLGLQVAGLCDAGEEGWMRRGLERAGLGADLTREQMAARGFHVCVRDLEDELIRALGVPAVEAVVAAQGELRSLRTLQNQPAQRGRSPQDQLRRFLGTRSLRKIRYGRYLVEALDLDHVPAPLDGVLTSAGRAASGR